MDDPLRPSQGLTGRVDRAGRMCPCPNEFRFLPTGPGHSQGEPSSVALRAAFLVSSVPGRQETYLTELGIAMNFKPPTAVVPHHTPCLLTPNVAGIHTLVVKATL